MSRHKLVKGMNLEDELDDYDGGADYGYGEEDETGIGDYRKMQDALWWYQANTALLICA
jgi:hypothetical protein